MPVLSKGEIERRLKLDLSDPGNLVVTPLLHPEDAFDADSLDLRLGSHFLLPRVMQQPFFCPDDRSSRFLHQRVHVPLGRYLVVPAHQTVLGATLEYIKLPHDASGQILTKSSVARTFIVIETAPWIHPNYRGCLTLEIANVSNTPLLLYPGRLIGQLILLKLEREDSKDDYDGEIEGTYLGPTLPEAPVFRRPQDDLAEIGIKRTLVIPTPEWSDRLESFRSALEENAALRRRIEKLE